ncbi:MAG: fibronectin type III domain-containing protein [Bacteroidia bacterium]|nr:fibronectin type III domain-containing protein [Bacteroidia bacterium]MBP7713495.1 fibronectin type III domain-containing protein [Bacteroidia bacterium]MBP8667337.1 fibronectin type III domain-containing protein [Bacteroidia bacterium]
MNKRFYLLLLICLPMMLWAQNLKPVAQKIFTAKQQQAVFATENLFTVSPENEQLNRQHAATATKATYVELNKSAIASLMSQKPDFLSLRIPINNNTVQVDLYKANIFTPDFSVTSAGSNGGAVNYTPGLHYQGIINGDNNSIAAISIFDDEVMALISTPAAGNFVIGRLENDRSNLHVIYNDADLTSRPAMECATLADNGTYTPQELQLPANRGMMVNCIRLYWEVNYNIFQGKGSITDAANYVTGLFNQSAIIYTNDNIPVELSEVYVWDVVSPYTGTTSSNYLSQFQTYRTSFNGDLGHLLGYGGGGGIAAGFSGICASNINSSKCYSGINSSYSNFPTYSWSVMVVTHEQGHLMGSRHTHACVWNGNNTAIDGCGPAAGYGYEGSCSGAPIPSGGGTIMSYCHLNAVGINLSLGFGSQPQAVIINKYNSGACLTACIGMACMPPPGMNTSSVNSTSAIFNWTAAASASSYVLRYRVVGTSTWTTATATASPYTATGLTPGSNYEWQVQTVCTGGSSIFTISTTFTTPPITCSVPTGTTTTNINPTYATFSWTAVSGALSYNVRYRLVGGSTWTTANTTSTSYTATSLTANSNYEWQVETVCAGGTTSGFSSSTTFSTPVQPCNTPQNNYTAAITSTSAMLYSSGSAGGVLNIQYKKASNSTWTILNNVSTPYTLTGLQPNTGYQWQVQMVCGLTVSPWSSTIPFTTLCDTPTAVLSPSGTINVCAGPVVLSANTGTGLFYQWLFNGNIISGADLSTYNATVSGSYAVIVTNLNLCSATSTTTIVNIGAMTGQITPSGTVSFCAGFNATLNATSGAGYTYQWYRNNVLLSNSSAALSINSSGTYKCVITSGSCTVTTNSVVGNQINNPTPVITTTTPTTFCAPGSVVLTANSFAGVQYQWQKNSVDIVGATAQNYTATSNGSYRVIETANGCSKSKTINVNAASSVSASIYTNDPTTLCNQGSVTMHVNIPIPGYSYQWKNNGNNISGATATSYTTNVSGNYSCNVSASCGNTNSNAIIVSIGSFNAQISPSGSQILCTGGSMLLSASSGIGFTHQWYKNGNAISGATSSTYSATSGGSYTVFISSPCGSGTSPAAVLTENTVSASVSPAGTSTVCAGIPFTFTANSGAGYSYRWYRNNVLLAGTGQSINATSAGQYKVEVSINGSCAVISNIAVLDVINNPAPVISPANATICNGAAQVFTANNFTGVTYQWYRNSVLIPGATAQTYSATLAGQYKVTQTANGCYKSKSAQLTVTSCREEGEGFIAEAQSNISISPNPFTDQLNIYVPSEKDGNAEIQVLDMLGKVVYRSVITLNQTSEINLHVPAGIYMLSVHTDGKYQVQKIVKSR